MRGRKKAPVDQYAPERVRFRFPSKGLLVVAGASRRVQLLTRVLAAIAVALVLLILAGTLYALFRDPPPVLENPGSTGGSETAMFTGIGRLRIPSGGGADSPVTVILSIVFPYPATDRPFTEELAGKIPLFRNIAREYFGALSPDDLVPLDEDKAKAELLGRFNRELQLGKIGVLFFNDLLVLE
jgi:flagellar basal body-associated protein FliL